MPIGCCASRGSHTRRSSPRSALFVQWGGPPWYRADKGGRARAARTGDGVPEMRVNEVADTVQQYDEMRAVPLLGHRAGGDIIAVRAGAVLRVKDYQRDVNQLAALLPDRKYVVNFCGDRYE